MGFPCRPRWAGGAVPGAIGRSGAPVPCVPAEEFGWGRRVDPTLVFVEDRVILSSEHQQVLFFRILVERQR